MTTLIVPHRPLPFLDGPQRPACAGNDVDPEWWFPGHEGSTAYERARPVCDGCPLKTPCANWAIDSGQGFGMWGSLTPEQIKAARATRHRQQQWGSAA